VAILRAEGLTRRFGGLVAVNAVSLSVEAGQVHGIIGPNGAGKTTLFNLISGFVSPDSGRLWLEEHEITRLPAHERSRLGVVRTFQNIRLFRGLSVLDNVLLGQYPVARPGYLAIWPRPTARERALRREALDLLELFHLAEVRERVAATLPYGAQKRVELARALAARPRVLLLDEPTAGMNAQESEEIADEILSIRARGITVVLVEHDMNVVMRTSDQVSVLNFGQKIAEGTPAQIQANPDVRLAYLGQEEEARAP
jgi:ABC-type branched-subunit amino acid transport system ATPase component